MTLQRAAPQATAAQQVMVSGDGGPFPWMLSTIPDLMAAGYAVTTINGGVLLAGAGLSFTPTDSFSTPLDGVNPLKSAIDNFTIDAGTF
jgi:hypothetical protein